MDPGEKRHWRLSIQNHMKCVGEANRSLAAYLEEQGVDPETRSTVELALEEVVTNVIKYAYEDDEPHEILLEVRRGLAGIVLRVTDDGRAFNPLVAPAPDFEKPVEDREAGGLGIHLFRSLAARLEYERLDGKNMLTVHLTENSSPSEDRSSSCP
jgi:anti-sigma regulatory factor (Ser/Thr protein kinase)